MTPRQTCPRPNGFGRNLRSKTRWFTGFCNSHQVSHFATFFIDARAEISVAESRFGFESSSVTPALTANGSRGAGCSLSIPWRFPRRGSLFTRAGASAPAGEVRAPSGGRRSAPTGRPPGLLNGFAGRSALQVSTMILPQVHLRKPCYDFSFL